ncbi:MAG: 23S rRNA (uracil(1939)-C(5))-methyltransferase RlmD [Lachnospiraceae bacterium]|nr:23S rRNA (uracil(1939)-C(5))-methyltransferase RlmD [Lachnospiraceae bacterium]
MNYRKNDEIKLIIDDLGNEGEGIGHIDGFSFFIKDTAVGDHVTAKVMKVKKNMGFAKLVSVDTPSPDRVSPACPVSKSCGGCTLQHISYEAELKYKDNKVYNCLKRIGGIPEEVLDRAKEPAVGMENTGRYRNKAQYPIGVNSEGKAIAGFYSGRTHHIVEAEDCFLSPPEFKDILRTVLLFLDEYRIPVYDETEGKGLIRHVLIRKGFNTGEIMTCIVASSEKIPHIDVLSERLMNISGMKSVCLNINPEKTNVILGSKCVPLYGPMYIEDMLCGLRFRISPLSFYQVNPVMAEKLYHKAMEYAGLTQVQEKTAPELQNGSAQDLSGDKRSEIWDICCGIGTITLTTAKCAPNSLIHGVEIVQEAIADAKENASLNSIYNVDFTAAPAEIYMPEYMKQNPGARADVVIVDPPRKGLKPEVLDTIAELSPSKVVYISCDPATLARDLKLLLASGYTLQKYQVYDQFSRTSHVETVCLLSKLHEAKNHVNVKLDMDELNLTSAEAKATYKEIEEWVQEHYGFHVTNLNIAQVKQKHGIIERENYNKPKTENSRQPGCPEEKVKAIEDALRNFKMI